VLGGDSTSYSAADLFATGAGGANVWHYHALPAARVCEIVGISGTEVRQRRRIML